MACNKARLRRADGALCASRAPAQCIHIHCEIQTDRGIPNHGFKATLRGRCRTSPGVAGKLLALASSGGTMTGLRSNVVRKFTVPAIAATSVLPKANSNELFVNCFDREGLPCTWIPHLLEEFALSRFPWTHLFVVNPLHVCTDHILSCRAARMVR